MSLALPLTPFRRLAGVAAGLLGLLLTAGTVLAGSGAVTTIEAGAYLDFVAPDAGTSTPGSITFGFSGTPEVIAATAALAPPADTNLASLGGGTPTCLEVTRESGEITALAFVAECTVSGGVVFIADLFGPGGDAYVIGDRVAAPAELIEGDPGFATLIGVPEATGGDVSVTFTIDPSIGTPESILGTTGVSGPVVLLAGGDIMVGDGTLPNAVIDDGSRALLTEAAGLGVDATVGIDASALLNVKGAPPIEITLSVSFTAPTPVPTPSPQPTAAALPDTATGSRNGPAIPATVFATGLALLALAAGLGGRLRRSS